MNKYISIIAGIGVAALSHSNLNILKKGNHYE